MSRPSFGRVGQFASRASEWVVLAYLLLAATPPILFRQNALTLIPHLNLLDGSWLLDTGYKASGGIWFGRDVAFTYGPLFQWLSSAPSRWIGVSAGSVYATGYTLPLYLAILATFLTARLLLPEAAGWRRALLVLLAMVFWSEDLRAALCLLAFVLFVRLTDEAVHNGVAGRGFAAAVVCATAFLISADTGIYCVAVFLFCIAATAAAEHAWRQMSALLLAAVASSGLLALAINATLFSPLNFRFWKSSLAIAAGYRWFEPARMAKGDKHLVIATLVLGALVFATAWIWRRPRHYWSAHLTFLAAGFCLALLMLQSAVVRSDYGHVRIGIYPMIFLGSVIVLSRFGRSLWLELASAAGLVILTALTLRPSSVFLPGAVVEQMQQLRQPLRACPEGYQQMDAACLPADVAQWLAEVAGFVRKQARPDAKIAVLSYETAVGLLSRHQVAGGVMQSYLVNGDYLTSLEVQGLERDRPAVGLYFPGSAANPPLDSVPTLTRSPELWLYYLRHYRLADRPASDVAGLLRDDSRESRLHMSSQDVGESLSAAISTRSTSLDLGQLRWPSQGADFLKLRLRVDYPLEWHLRKPSCYVLQMTFANGTERAVQFVVPPGRDTDVWVFPWDDLGLVHYFSADEAQWRVANRPALTGLELIVTPFDWLSVVPESVTVESIEAVRIDLQ